MFQPHILLKIIQRLNPLQLKNLLLSSGQTSKQVAELLRGNLFPEVEITNHGNELQYKITSNKTDILSYVQLVQTELATNAYKIKLNQEDILEKAILEPIQVIDILPFKINEKAKYLKVTFKKEIINFLILLIESLRSQDKFKIKTYYTGSDIYFEFKSWSKLVWWGVWLVREGVVGWGGLGGKWGF